MKEIPIKYYNEWALLENRYRFFDVYFSKERALKKAMKLKAIKQVRVSHAPQGTFYVYVK